MAIPKIIHYCWFGGREMPVEYMNYINHWKEILPDYEFKRWDESSCDLNSNKFVQLAYQKKKWAFVSDYFRLKALYEYGGIYLDTDVELYKNFDELLKYKFFCGYIWNCLIGTAVLGAEKGSFVIQNIMKTYEVTDELKMVPNNHQFTEFFLSQSWFKLNGEKIEHDGILILPKEAFEVPPFFGHGYAEHHVANSWHDKVEKSSKLKRIIKKLVPHSFWRQVGAYKALKKNDYYKVYIKEKQ